MATPDASIHRPPPSLRSTQYLTRSATPTSSARGSLTQLITESNTPDRSPSPSLVLRLRGAHEPLITASQDALDQAENNSGEIRPTRRRRRIQWDTSVIDNEGLGRKKSKVCCIYHKPRAVGESSSDESSSSSDEDSENDSGSSDSGRNVDGARPARGMAKSNRRRQRNGRGHRRDHKHDHHQHQDRDHDAKNDACCSGHNDGDNGGLQARRPSPNAYERMPKYDVKPLKYQPGKGT